jgi:hypothetical protein
MFLDCVLTLNLWVQIVPSEPSQLKQLQIGPVQPSTGTGVANNGRSPAGRLVTKSLRLVLADKFGNTVVGATTDRLLLLAEVLDAEISEEPSLPGEIRPLDVQFFFCNDADRAKKVLLCPQCSPGRQYSGESPARWKW